MPLTPAALALIARIEARDKKMEPDMERVTRAAKALTKPEPKPKITHDTARRHYMKPGHHRGCSGFSQPHFFQ